MEKANNPLQCSSDQQLNVSDSAFMFASHWTGATLAEPPLTKRYDEVRGFVLNKLTLKHPCHNQVVERHIRVVSGGASKVLGVMDTSDKNLNQGGFKWKHLKAKNSTQFQLNK